MVSKEDEVSLVVEGDHSASFKFGFLGKEGRKHSANSMTCRLKKVNP